ncbi:2-dehydropantoate 2-reductase [Bacillus sp. 31A1R]|uniref:2-dehydropantoate 2-reductase n=1 Tax=Robertmurraya mangrovi TaxID=3098077 RepID=A0ABU5IVY5_9BACI|nr:2-dehydropantoate 2-reductase [Bacillus sp. 31A1R]MDZ5471317.1 2-dehydropantoate 2-reductase [Bacillus sp. 31A1R]
MEITIVGAGAIGGVLGAYLTLNGENVLLCDIAENHVQKINQEGIKIEGPVEVLTVDCKAMTPKELVGRGKPLEMVLLAVKAHHTKTAIEQLRPLLKKETVVVSVQNGLCEKQISRLIGAENTIGCFVNFSADYLEPGRILYGGISSLYIGELDGSVTDRLKNLHKRLLAWGPAQITNNIWGYLWGKMSYAGLLYATALVDETMAGVVRQLDLRETLMELCSEILAVAEAEGVHPLGFDDWEPGLVYPREARDDGRLNKQLEKLAVRMASNKKTKSGIWRDLAVRKRKTEIEEQLVPIVEMGKEHGIAMPLTENLIQQILEIETGARQMDWGNLYELKAIFERIKENEVLS